MQPQTESSGMTLEGLRTLLSFYGVDERKFRKPVHELLNEYHARDFEFFMPKVNGVVQLSKFRSTAKVFMLYGDLQLREVRRVFPKGETVESRKEWAFSGTVRKIREKLRNDMSHLPNERLPGETPLEGAIREVSDETKRELVLRPDQLIALYGGQPIIPPPRESGVWVGINAYEYQYHFLHRMEWQRWPGGYVVHEADGTEIHLEWGPKTLLYPEGIYPEAHQR